MKNLLSIIALFLLTLGPAVAQQDETPVVYDYVSIVATGNRIQFINIAGSSVEHERHRIKTDSRASFDFRELFKVVNRFEKKGYELYSNDFEITAENTRNYFLLRKPRQSQY